MEGSGQETCSDQKEDFVEVDGSAQWAIAPSQDDGGRNGVL